jgi:hypothetical protein
MQLKLKSARQIVWRISSQSPVARNCHEGQHLIVGVGCETFAWTKYIYLMVLEHGSKYYIDS